MTKYANLCTAIGGGATSRRAETKMTFWRLSMAAVEQNWKSRSLARPDRAEDERMRERPESGLPPTPPSLLGAETSSRCPAGFSGHGCPSNGNMLDMAECAILLFRRVLFRTPFRHFTSNARGLSQLTVPVPSCRRAPRRRAGRSWRALRRPGGRRRTCRRRGRGRRRRNAGTRGRARRRSALRPPTCRDEMTRLQLKDAMRMRGTKLVGLRCAIPFSLMAN